MQVGLTERDKTILAVAANTSGGSIGEISAYSDIAKKLGLDEMDTDKKTEEVDGNNPENYELERREVKLLYMIMGRGSAWSFSKEGREAVKTLYERLRRLVTE
jgi:hypothetical protein